MCKRLQAQISWAPNPRASNSNFLFKIFACLLTYLTKPQVSSAHAVEREFRVLRALCHTNVPVPKALLLCEDSSVVGTPFYVMEFVNGRIFCDSSLPGMNRHDRAAAYASAAETLAKIHSVPFRAVGLGGYGRSGGGYFGRQVETLARVAKKQVGRAGGGD